MGESGHRNLYSNWVGSRRHNLYFDNVEVLVEAVQLITLIVVLPTSLTIPIPKNIETEVGVIAKPFDVSA